MRKIKLLHISRATEFGIYRFLMDLIKYINKDKFEIVVACPEQGPLLEDLRNRGIRVIPVGMKREISFADDIKSFFSILHILRKEEWDIVHTHCSKAGFLGRIASRLVGIPVIAYTPNSWYFDEPLPRIKKKFYIYLERFAALFGDVIVTVTEEEKEEIIRKKIAKRTQIVTIHDGIDVSLLKEEDSGYLKERYGIPKVNKVVGMIARLVPQKDPCTFVRLAYEVTKENPNVTFVLIGDGPLRGDVENLKSQLGLGDRLVIIGVCDVGKELNEFLNLIDISVLTSLYEGLPLVALQSMYLKKPLIITKVRGINEVIENNNNGFMIPIGDITSMKKITLELLKNEEKTNQIGMEAHKRVGEHFTAENMATKYEKLYIDVLSRKDKA